VGILWLETDIRSEQSVFEIFAHSNSPVCVDANKFPYDRFRSIANGFLFRIRSKTDRMC
jgi:hypothetical protein